MYIYIYIYIYRDKVDKGKYKQNIKEELENSKYMYMYLKLEKPYGVEQSVTSHWFLLQVVVLLTYPVICCLHCRELKH